MKCVSCETEINPKWKHAIDINVCPFCGKHIMEEHLKNCLVNLSAAMDDMQKYTEQLDDWMLSNHNYIKTDSPQLKMYLPKEAFKEMRKELEEEEFQEKKMSIAKIKMPDGMGGFTEEEVVVEKVQSDNKAKSFHERANNMLKKEKAVDGEPKSVTEKTQYLKEMAQRIKSEGAPAIVNEAGLASMIRPSKIDSADPETVAELQSMLASGDIIASGLPETSSGDDDEIPSVVLSMASRAKKGSGGGVNEADLQSLHEMQNKAKSAQKKLASGKGGFSRS